MATGTRPKSPLAPGLPPPSSAFEQAVYQILNAHNLAGATQRTVDRKDIASLASEEFVRARNRLEVLSVQDAAGLTTVDFVHGTGGVLFEAGYAYSLHGLGLVPTTNIVQPHMLVSTDAGATWAATTYDWGGYALRLGSAATVPGLVNTTLIRLWGDLSMGSASGENFNFDVEWAGLAQSSVYATCTVTGWGYDDAPGSGQYRGIGAYKTLAAIDGLRVAESSGNGFSAGKVWLQRVKLT